MMMELNSINRIEELKKDNTKNNIEQKRSFVKKIQKIEKINKKSNNNIIFINNKKYNKNYQIIKIN